VFGPIEFIGDTRRARSMRGTLLSKGEEVVKIGILRRFFVAGPRFLGFGALFCRIPARGFFVTMGVRKGICRMDFWADVRPLGVNRFVRNRIDRGLVDA
jgi:hypothetical protein